MGGYNEFKLSSSCYLRLMAGKPQGLILNEKREPIGLFIVTHGLNALKKHCFDPSESKWITIHMHIHVHTSLKTQRPCKI